MSEVFFIGDTHFGHRKIIQFEETQPFRPFETIEEHDAELIRRWNSVVRKQDSVWHLGDFCFGKANLALAAELNGVKRLVLGNHDMYPAADYLRYFSRLCGIVEYKGAVLSHAPLHESQLSRWHMNIHGHLHTHTLNDPRYVNVSAEQIELTPISYDEILLRRKEHS